MASRGNGSRNGNGNGYRRVLYRWHRRIGLTAALFVLFLSVTGLTLNHTDALRLDERFVTASSIQDLYGLGVPDDVTGYAAGGQRLSLLGDMMFLDGARLDGHYEALAGAVAVDGQLFAVADGDLLVLLPDGRLVERLGPVNGVPAMIEAIGLTTDSRLAVMAGEHVSVTDVSVTGWQPIEDTSAIRWSRVSPTPPDRLRELRARYRDRMLSFERVLLDLHSGRIFGPIGPRIMDAMALLFIALAATGFWMWMRRPPHAAPPGQRYRNGRADRVGHKKPG